MALPTENEDWLIDEGIRIIEKRIQHGDEHLTPREKLTYCLWVADYGMQNAGDLLTAADLHPNFQIEGLQLAKECRLPQSIAAFSLQRAQLETEYFARFEAICDEIRAMTD